MSFLRVHFVSGVLLGSAMLLAGCPSQTKPDSAPTPRIISHSPALTEILLDMGYGDHLVGVTNWCSLPDGLEIPRVADAHGIRLEVAAALQPQLILTQSNPSKFDGLKRAADNLQVVQIRLESLGDVYEAMKKIRALMGDDNEQADQLMRDFGQFTFDLAESSPEIDPNDKPNVLFISGWERPTAAGPGTFIGDLISIAGGNDVGGMIPGNQLWRKANVEAILATRPDVLIVHTSPGEVDRAKAFWASQEMQSLLPAAKTGRVVVVTGDAWQRPSTRLVKIAPIIAAAIYPPKE